MALLREVASRGSSGWRLTDLAAHCGLDKATAYRMLRCLEEERLVKRRASDRHYLPGPLLFELVCEPANRERTRGDRVLADSLHAAA